MEDHNVLLVSTKYIHPRGKTIQVNFALPLDGLGVFTTLLHLDSIFVAVPLILQLIAPDYEARLENPSCTRLLKYDLSWLALHTSPISFLRSMRVSRLVLVPMKSSSDPRSYYRPASWLELNARLDSIYIVVVSIAPSSLDVILACGCFVYPGPVRLNLSSGLSTRIYSIFLS